MLEHWRDGVDALVVTMSFIKDATLLLAADPAQPVIVIGPGIVLFGLVFSAHFVVVDTRQNMKILSRPGIHSKRVRLVMDLELLLVEHGSQRAVRIIDLDRDELRIN